VSANVAPWRERRLDGTGELLARQVQYKFTGG
jgi:hypothetical protein